MADKGFTNIANRLYIPVYEGTEFKASSTNSRGTFEQWYQNGWPESNPLQANSQPADYNFVVRPGTAEVQSLATSTTTATAIFTAFAGAATVDTTACIYNMVVTQLYDVYVAAFYDDTSNKIFIMQYRPVAGTATLIGTYTSCTAKDQIFITEITDGASLTAVQVQNGSPFTPGIAVSYQRGDRAFGSGAYALSSAGVFTGSSLTTIANTSFPSNLTGTARVITGPFQFMNGHSYIMTIDGFIYESQNTNGNPDITNWNVLSTVTASQYPDRGIGIYRYKDMLCAIGQDSIEFFSGTNLNPPQSTLVRTDQAFIKFGALDPRLVINANDVLYFVSYGSTSTLGVWKLEGYVPTKISTPREDFVLMAEFSPASLPHTKTCYSIEMALIANKQHLIFNGCEGMSFNLADKVWWYFSLNGTTLPIYPASSFGSTYPATTFSQYCFIRTTTTTGNNVLGLGAGYSNMATRVFQFIVASSGAFFRDFQCTISSVAVTTAIPWFISFNTKWFNNAAKKRLNRLEVLSDGYTDATTLTMVRDGVMSTPVSRTMDGGSTGRHYCNNLGTARSVMFKLVGSTLNGSDQIRIRGIDLSLAQGTH